MFSLLKSGGWRGAYSKSSRRMSVFVNSNTLWENGKILNYCFVPPQPGNAIQQQKVVDRMREWEQYANVTFKPIDPKHAFIHDIRITFDPHAVSSSQVGRDLEEVDPDLATINFNEIHGSRASSLDERRVILHEFGHILGLLHEHQSPSREGVIVMDNKRMLDAYAALPSSRSWSPAVVHEQILDVDVRAGHYSRFDADSIMMYYLPPGTVTVKMVTNVTLRQRENSKLSDLDKAYMVLTYPRSEPHENAREWTVEHALDVVGFESRIRAAILQASKAGPTGWIEMRRILASVRNINIPLAPRSARGTGSH